MIHCRPYEVVARARVDLKTIAWWLLGTWYICKPSPHFSGVDQGGKNERNKRWALTFWWSMWRRSLISLNVLLASIILSNALPIFLIATCSCVSELTAALKRNIVQVNVKSFPANKYQNHEFGVPWITSVESQGQKFKKKENKTLTRRCHKRLYQLGEWEAHT